MNIKDKFSFVCICIDKEVGAFRQTQIEQLCLPATKAQGPSERMGRKDCTSW